MATPKASGEVLKIYTADEIAGELKTCKKSVLNLIKRGLLKALPGLRHKRITEAEFHRYLGVKAGQNGAALTPALAKPSCNLPATLPARPAGSGRHPGQIAGRSGGEGRGVPVAQ